MCSNIRGIRKRHPFSYAVQLTWIDQWLIYSAAWHVSFPFTLSLIFFKVELGVLCSVLKEFQTCGVSSATDVAQLDTCILENITTKPRLLQFYAALPSPNKLREVLPNTYFQFFSCNACMPWRTCGHSQKKDSSTPIRSDKTLAFLNFPWQNPIKSSVSILGLLAHSWTCE